MYLLVTLNDLISLRSARVFSGKWNKARVALKFFITANDIVPKAEVGSTN